MVLYYIKFTENSLVVLHFFSCVIVYLFLLLYCNAHVLSRHLLRLYMCEHCALNAELRDLGQEPLSGHEPLAPCRFSV